MKFTSLIQKLTLWCGLAGVVLMPLPGVAMNQGLPEKMQTAPITSPSSSQSKSQSQSKTQPQSQPQPQSLWPSQSQSPTTKPELNSHVRRDESEIPRQNSEWSSKARANMRKGGVDGGGGGAILCEAPGGDQRQFVGKMTLGRLEIRLGRSRDAYRSPLTNGKTIQFLDLWEAAAGYGSFYMQPVPIVYSEESVEVLTERAMSRLANAYPEFAASVQESLSRVIRRQMSIPEGTYVTPPADTNVRFLPMGCEIVGFGAYSDSDDNLVIDQRVWNEVTPTDRAALYIHEAVYKTLRDHGISTDSQKTRHIVGLMFSMHAFTRADIEAVLNH